jgi:peptide/nickel transport system substrate-binding protein
MPSMNFMPVISFGTGYGRRDGASFSQRPVRETPDPRRVSFRLKEPWPDFLTFYPTATGAGWVVPKKYLQKVGDDGFKKAPIGAGPYKFVSDAAAEQ